MLQLVLFARQRIDYSADLKDRQRAHQRGRIKFRLFKKLFKTEAAGAERPDHRGLFGRIGPGLRTAIAILPYCGWIVKPVKVAEDIIRAGEVNTAFPQELMISFEAV